MAILVRYHPTRSPTPRLDILTEITLLGGIHESPECLTTIQNLAPCEVLPVSRVRPAILTPDMKLQSISESWGWDIYLTPTGGI